jgi:hypothetical protein
MTFGPCKVSLHSAMRYRQTNVISKYFFLRAPKRIVSKYKTIQILKFPGHKQEISVFIIVFVLCLFKYSCDLLLLFRMTDESV